MKLDALSFIGMLTAAAGFAACGGSAPAQDFTASTSQPIIHGKASDSSQDAVVLIEGVVAGFACSGTLLAPNLVLTARHCVSQLASEGVQCDWKGNGTADSAVGADYVAGTLFIYVGAKRPAGFGGNPAAKGAKIIHDGATNLCNHDLALILLDRMIDGAKISPIRLDSPPVKKEMITAVGWGISETTAEPSVRLQRNGIAIITVGPSAVSAIPTPPHNFQVGESICQGDSGGPGYAESTGAIIGVVSYGGNGSGNTSVPWGGCVDDGNGVSNMYTEVAPFKDVILGAYQEAGQDPWLEGQPNPLLAKLNDPCGAGADCQSNICYTPADGNNSFCTSDCSSSDCPTDYDCKDDANAGTKICVPHVASPPPTASTDAGGTVKAGCAVARVGDDASAVAWGAFAALSLFVARRRRSKSLARFPVDPR